MNDWLGVEVPRDIYASCWGRIRASVAFFRQCTRFKMCSLLTASSCFPFPTSHKYLSFLGVRESGREGERVGERVREGERGEKTRCSL